MGLTPFECTERIRRYSSPVAALAGPSNHIDIPVLATLAAGPLNAEELTVQRRLCGREVLFGWMRRDLHRRASSGGLQNTTSSLDRLEQRGWVRRSGAVWGLTQAGANIVAHENFGDALGDVMWTDSLPGAMSTSIMPEAALFGLGFMILAIAATVIASVW